MGDEHHTVALGGKALDKPHQAVRLLGGQHGGGLVHDQDAGVDVEGLEDFNFLLLSHGQLPHGPVHGHVEAVVLGNLPQFGLVLLDGDVAVYIPQDDVLRRRVGRHQGEMLLDHRDAPAHGVGGALDLDRLSVDEDGPLVHSVQPVQDFHNRALARAVFPQERHHLAVVHGEGYVPVGHNLGKAFGDMLKLYCRRSHILSHSAAACGTQNRI